MNINSDLMDTFGLFFLFLSSLKTGVLCLEEPEVEIDEYFGDVKFHGGIVQKLSCVVYNPVEGGEVAWLVGDSILDARSTRRVVGEEGEYIENLNFKPTLKDNGKSLKCQYSGPSGEQYSDEIKMEIYMLDLNPVTPELVKEGESLTLEATATLYPAPSSEDVVWEVLKRDGELVSRLYPGSNQSNGVYTAGSLQSLSENLYRMDLIIESMDAIQAGLIHRLTVTTLGVTTSTEFDIAVQLRQPSAPTTGPETKNETKIDSAEEKVENLNVITSNVSIVIIIVVIVVVLLILCTVFLCCRKKKKSRNKNKQMYTAVKTTGPLEGQAL